MPISDVIFMVAAGTATYLIVALVFAIIVGKYLKSRWHDD